MIDHLLCADWSKEPRGRALYAADVRARVVYRVKGRRLTVQSALDAARDLSTGGSVLLSFDLPLGLPQSYLTALRSAPVWQGVSRFTDFLPLAARSDSFFVSGKDAKDWSVQRPFFCVPSGRGGREAFEAAACGAGVDLRRRIDRKTAGNPVFITSGIPGSVGSAAIDAWTALGGLLPRDRDFRLWPFEGTVPTLFAATRVVVAENYPRAAYAAALSDLPAPQRPRIRVSKTAAAIRETIVKHLTSRPWIARHGVTLQDTAAALADENAFDALLTAAGLLRLLLDGEPLSSPEFEDPVAEGGILGTGAINFDLAEACFPSAGGSAGPRATRNAGQRAAAAPTHACPIPGCSKQFVGGRGGWDSHAGSLRNHPNWHPDVTPHGDRVELFRTEFPSFFS
jgi:hypothetical protein